MNNEILTQRLPALQAGDVDVWTEVVIHFQPKLHERAIDLGLCHADAEDCVSEVFAKLYTDRFLGLVFLEPGYFYKTLFFYVSAAWRKSRRREVSLEGFDNATLDGLMSQLMPLETNRRAIVKELFKCLQPHEVDLLRLRYFENLTLKECGERLGLSISGAFSLHARIINKLKRWCADGDS
jgi:RNA polymerase sigma factor (sigma-70 family)